MGVLVSILAGYLPMILFAALVYWSDRYEKEPGLLIGAVFHWGAIIAAAAAFIINSIASAGFYFLSGSEQAAEFATTSLAAPIFEESLKGFAVLLVFLLARQEFDSILDGIIYAAVTALGFAATENAFYIYTYGFQNDGWAGLLNLFIIRVLIVGWQHPFYTAFIGIGLAKARLSVETSKKFAYPFLGWIAAVLLHSLHNTLVTLLSGAPGRILETLFEWSGWLILLGYVLLKIRQEQQTLVKHLGDEIDLGTLTSDQYRLVCSSAKRAADQWKRIGKPAFREADTFYRLCGELAHKKNQLALFGDENGNQKIIGDLRSQIRQRSTLMQS